MEVTWRPRIFPGQQDESVHGVCILAWESRVKIGGFFFLLEKIKIAEQGCKKQKGLRMGGDRGWVRGREVPPDPGPDSTC